MTTNHLPESQYLAGEREAELAALRADESFTFSVESELAVVGHDPEYADMDNPNGEIIRLRYFMVATDSVGHQYRYGYERTEALAEATFQHFAPPVSEWSLWRCIYGSIAYELEGCETAQLIDEMENDLGPNWMTKAPEVALALAAKGAI
jgi:hypothetical protein